MSKRYNPPPNWPQPPQDWTPPPGWQPDASWGPPPPGWQLWTNDQNWFVRHKVLSAIGAMLLLFVAIGVANGGSDPDVVETAAAGTSDDATDPVDSPSASPTATKKATTKAPAVKKEPGIGSAVRDGKFRFTVTKMTCGKTLIGSADFGSKAQGEFCLVNLSVKNIGDKPQTLFGDNQKLFIGKREYSADTEAGIYLDNAQSFIEEINPGNSLKGVVVFDVPKGANPDKIELHDSAFSGGVDVRL